MTRGFEKKCLPYNLVLRSPNQKRDSALVYYDMIQVSEENPKIYTVLWAPSRLLSLSDNTYCSTWLGFGMIRELLQIQGGFAFLKMDFLEETTLCERIVITDVENLKLGWTETMKKWNDRVWNKPFIQQCIRPPRTSTDSFIDIEEGSWNWIMIYLTNERAAQEFCIGKNQMMPQVNYTHLIWVLFIRIICNDRLDKIVRTQGLQF